MSTQTPKPQAQTTSPPADLREAPDWSRRKALPLVILVWGGIFLPGLGLQEFKGEEATRVLPAIHMLDTGDWVLPQIGGLPYFNKPPMINWLVAGSFAMTGSESEGAARLVSVSAILAMVVLLVALRNQWLDVRSRALAAVVFMTFAAMVDKGRLIEIEPTYVCFTGMAVIWWLAMFSRGHRGWLLWLPASIPLSAAMLTKGPMHLGPVLVTCAVVWLREEKLRTLLRPGVLSAVIMAGLVTFGPGAIWAWLARRRVEELHASANMTRQWSAQLGARFLPNTIRFGKWIEEALNSFKDLLPWLLVAPLWWSRTIRRALPRDRRRIFRTLRLAAVLSFGVLLLIPGLKARYVLPASPLVAMMLGWTLAHYRTDSRVDLLWKWALHGMFVLACAVVVTGMIILQHGLMAWAATAVCFAVMLGFFYHRDRHQGTSRLVFATAAGYVLVLLIYAAYAGPIDRQFSRLRPAARGVARHVPKGETIYCYRVGRQAFLYYLREPKIYLHSPDQISPDMTYFVMRREEWETIQESLPSDAMPPEHVVHEMPDRVKGEYILVQFFPAEPRP